MGTKTEIYATFVMTVVAEEDDSRSIWPSCPAFGWSTGLANPWAVCLLHLLTPYHRFITSVSVTCSFFDVLSFLTFFPTTQIPWFVLPDTVEEGPTVDPIPVIISPGVHKLDCLPNGEPLTTPATGVGCGLDMELSYLGIEGRNASWNPHEMAWFLLFPVPSCYCKQA